MKDKSWEAEIKRYDKIKKIKSLRDLTIFVLLMNTLLAIFLIVSAVFRIPLNYGYIMLVAITWVIFSVISSAEEIERYRKELEKLE